MESPTRTRSVYAAASAAPSDATRWPIPVAARWTLWFAAALLMAWSAWSFTEIGSVGAFVKFVGVAFPLSIGLGVLVFRLAGVSGRAAGGLIGLVPAGWALAALITFVFMWSGWGVASMPMLALGAAVGVAWAVWDNRRRLREWALGTLGSGELALGAFIVAAVWRVFASGSRFFVFTDTKAIALQYFDFSFHLAFIKAGLQGGMPIDGYPMGAGLGRQAYHPALWSLAVTIFEKLGLPTDAAYFGLFLPMVYTAFALAVAAAVYAFARSWRAVGLALAMGSLTLLGLLFNDQLAEAIGRFGSGSLQWLMRNPPASLGGCVFFVAVLLLAASGEPKWRTAAVSGAFVGFLISTKAQFFTAAAPAFGLALICAWALKRVSWREVLAGAVTSLGVFVPSFLSTTGGGAGPKVEFGGMAAYMRHAMAARRGDGTFLREAAAQVTGPLGDAMFLLLFIFFGVGGWRLWVALGALGWALKSKRDPFKRANTAWLMLGWTVLGVVAVSFTLVQHDQYDYVPWNIAYHAIQLMWPITLLAAAVWLDAALPEGLVARRVPALARWALTLVVAVALIWLGVVGVTKAREIGTRKLPKGFVQAVRALPKVTPPDAVVVQDFETRFTAWTAGYGGRTAFVERGDSTGLLQGTRWQRYAALFELYSTTDPTVASEIASKWGIDYAIVSPDQPAEGLRRATSKVYSTRGWQIRKFGSQ